MSPKKIALETHDDDEVDNLDASADTLINKMRNARTVFSLIPLLTSASLAITAHRHSQISKTRSRPRDQTESTTDEYVYFMTSDPLSERAALSEARHELAEQSNYLAINNPSSNACNHHDYQYVPLN